MYVSTIANDENANRNIPADIYYMVIDTETTGVPNNNYQDWTNCRLIQLGIVVKDRLFETVYEECLTVQFDGTNGTTPDSFNIHGISDAERIDAMSSQSVCEEFISVAERCDVLISHGNAFDFGVVFRECLINNIDISCLIGKTVVNTKQSEHYRGFHENLSQTVERINPNWTAQSNYLNNEAHIHNALYDAHLCAELYRLSHHPSMNRPMQDLIEFLNLRRYYGDINDIRVRINDMRSNIIIQSENHHEEEPNEEIFYNDYSDNDEEEYSNISWVEASFEEEEDQYIPSEEEEYAYENESYDDDQTTTEDYIHSMCCQDGKTFDHHAPEDYA
jgi:DNA polymerase III epsilon subunit-like protein